jgi:hypothetical protein
MSSLVKVTERILDLEDCADGFGEADVIGLGEVGALETGDLIYFESQPITGLRIIFLRISASSCFDFPCLATLVLFDLLCSIRFTNFSYIHYCCLESVLLISNGVATMTPLDLSTIDSSEFEL